MVMMVAFCAFRNGSASELTLLMRSIYEEAEVAKQAIGKGERPVFTVNLEAILTAQPSVESKTKHPQYRRRAKEYLKAAAALQQSSAAEQKQAFNNMVDACMACHRLVCPGPMVRIEKLYFK